MVVKRPENDKLAGVYRGRVLKHLQHGKCKIWIPGVYAPEFIDMPDSLPDAEQAASLFGGVNNGNGEFAYPDIDSAVWCFFENGDQNLPVYFAASLGGPNAFGQYQDIKPDSLSVSDAHLITSGKSHLKLHENGYISASVFDPARTCAVVEYVEESGNISAKPECDLVRDKAIRNISCDIVLDNSYRDGSFSAHTYIYDPANSEGSAYISATGEISTYRKSQISGADTAYERGNDGWIADTQGKWITSSDSVVDSIPSLKQFQTSSLNFSSRYNSGEMSNAGKSVKKNIDTTIQKNSRYNFVDGEQKYTIQRTHDQTTTKTAYAGLDSENGLEICRDTIDDVESALINTKTGQDIGYSLNNYKSGNVSFAENTAKLGVEGLKTEKYTDKGHSYETYWNEQYSGQTVFLSGFQTGTQYKLTDRQTINGQTQQKHYDSANSISAYTGRTSAMKLTSKYKRVKTIGSSTKTRNIVCWMDLDSENGCVQMCLSNLFNGKYCSIEMDAGGNMILRSSKSIVFDSPYMEFTGDTMRQTFDSISEKGQTVNIAGGTGDCKIKGISLVGHTHQEKQSGDVVYPGQPTSPPQ